uniref:Ovule protein n=1 Tax=Parascaris univalens TaxID=6257 RepID=A0A914ZQ22_PARUN
MLLMMSKNKNFSSFPYSSIKFNRILLYMMFEFKTTAKYKFLRTDVYNRINFPSISLTKFAVHFSIYYNCCLIYIFTYVYTSRP